MKAAPLTLDQRLAETVQAVRDRVPLVPRVGVVLDVDHGGFADRLRSTVEVPYRSLPHMPSRSGGPDGRMFFGLIDDVPVACLVGRSYLGQGVPAWQVVHGVRVLARLGIRVALVTAVAGVLEPTWTIGDVMLVVDHLNFAMHEGLGTLADEVFEISPNMRTAYDRSLNAELHEVVRTEKLLAARLGTSTIDVVEGVYANLQDPTYETPAQMRMLRSLGAHAVGTSAALEVTALRQLGVRTAALAHLSYRAVDLEERSLDDEVTARSDHSHLQRLVRGWILRVNRLVE